MKLSKEQRKLIENFNKVFNHTWPITIKFILETGEYDKNDKILLNIFREAYVEWGKENYIGVPIDIMIECYDNGNGSWKIETSILHKLKQTNYT